MEEQGATGFTRVSRIRYSEAQPALLEVEEEEEEEEVEEEVKKKKKKAAASSPSRGTRASSRTSLSVQPQVSRQTQPCCCCVDQCGVRWCEGRV